MRNFLIFTFVALACHAWASWHINPQFDAWYPFLRPQMQYFIRHECSTAYHGYLQGECPPPLPSQPSKFNPKTCKAEGASFLTNCLLNHMPEVDKGFMAGAALLLGLVPTVLSLAAPSTIETGVLALRRPFLAFLLAAGSPTVSALRTFDYRDYSELLQIRHHNKQGAESALSPHYNIRAAFEYIFATAAATNVLLVSWQLSNRTIFAAGAAVWGFPILWTLLTIPIHVLGALAVYLRVELRLIEDTIRSMARGPRLLPISVWRHAREEFRPSALQHRAVMRMREESNLFILASWSTSTLTILHIILGTLVLGSTLFISPGDATTVVAQYLASTLVCRAIVSFEMRGIRKTVVSEEPATLVENK